MPKNNTVEEQQKARLAEGQEDNKPKGPLGSPDNPVSVQQAAPRTADLTSATDALTPAQRAGLEPIDKRKDEEEQARKPELTNLQTTHEAENALDGVSGGPTPGITENHALTGPQGGQTLTDMNGRAPMGLQAGDKDLIPVITKKLRDRKRADQEANLPEDQQGWMSAADMGLSGAQLRRLYENGGDERLEAATIPNGHFFPDSGTRYRLK